MHINVKVVPRAHKNCVEVVDDVYIVRTTATPTDGKANAMVQRMLAEHFGIAKSCVCIIRGHKNRKKIVDISSL